MASIGFITTNAATNDDSSVGAGEYWLWYKNDGSNDMPFSNKTQMDSSNGKVSTTLEVQQSKNFGFIITTSSASCTTDVIWNTAPDLSYSNDDFYWFQSGEYTTDKKYYFFKGCANKNFTMKIEYDLSSSKLTASQNNSEPTTTSPIEPTTAPVTSNLYTYKGTDTTVNPTPWQPTAMNKSMDGFYEYVKCNSQEGATNKFLIGTKNNPNAYKASKVTPGFNNTDITASYFTTTGENDIECTFSGEYYVLVYYPNTTVNSSTEPVICASTTLPGETVDPHNVTIKGNIKVTATAEGADPVVLNPGGDSETEGSTTVFQLQHLLLQQVQWTITLPVGNSVKVHQLCQALLLLRQLQ